MGAPHSPPHMCAHTTGLCLLTTEGKGGEEKGGREERKRREGREDREGGKERGKKRERLTMKILGI